MPIVTVSQTEITPVNSNDPALAERLRVAAVAILGKDHVEVAESTMGSEDVGLFSLGDKIPAVMFWLGAADPAKLAHAKETGVPLPGLHSALFAPDYAPTIATGVTAMTSMALDLLK
jgi:hippurate hydrolase